MRRITVICVAAFLLAVTAAQAGGTSTVQLHNQTNHELQATAHVRGVIVQRNFSPHTYVVLGEVENGTCVKVRVARDAQLHHHCTGTPFDVRFACDLPAGMHCLYNLRSTKDVVVSITQRG